MFEDSINTKKYNVNKKELVLQLYTELFGDSTEEYLTKIADDIEYLWNHNSIHKTKLYKKVLGWSYNFVKNCLSVLIK
jgi:hypothetical protein